MMNFSKMKMPQIAVIFLIITTLITACSPQALTELPAQQPVEPTESRLQTDTAIGSTTTPTSKPASTPLPLTLFLDNQPPVGMISSTAPFSYKRSIHSDNTLWFGVKETAPEGDLLKTSTWVYALAAPFPTIIDDISKEDFQQLWFGGDAHREMDNPNISTRTLYIPKTISGIMENLWGHPDGTTVKAVETIPGPDTLWKENAWAIIPFEQLQPKLKVISIDGKSPLFKDFVAADYPLSFQYQVIEDKPLNNTFNDEDIQTILDSVKSTNRDPEKMTTLVMTGVTALVRGTAYRMETKGVLYPGLEIADWLSSADITHISNEVSFYEDCPFPDPDSGMLLFCSNPEYIELFDYVGADIIELSGNHNNDAKYVYGVDVVDYNLDLYEQHGMTYLGGGRNLEDAQTPRIITHNGNTLAFIGCNAPGPEFAWATEDRGGAAPCGDYQWMADEVTRLRQQGILPIATYQYYEDYYNFAASHHIRDFGRIAQAGAVIVNGSQAHRPKAMAFVENTFIDYGLGNLFFDQMGVTVNDKIITQTRWEIIQRHTFYDGRYLSTELLTAMLMDYAQPRPMTTAERSVFLDELFTASEWISR